MAQDQHHIIDKLVVELEVSKPQDAHECQSKIDWEIEHYLEEKLERQFSQLSGEAFIQVDRLELDLGQFQPDEIKMEFMTRLHHQFVDTLDRLIRQQSPEINRMTRKQLLFQTFTHFLETGRYPWHAGKHLDEAMIRNPGALIDEVWDLDHDFVSHFLKQHLQMADLRSRLLQYLDGQQFIDLAVIHTGIDESQLRGAQRSIISLWELGVFQGTDRREIDRAYREAVLEHYHGRSDSTVPLGTRLLNHLYGEENLSDKRSFVRQLHDNEETVWKLPDDDISRSIKTLTALQGAVTVLQELSRSSEYDRYIKLNNYLTIIKKNVSSIKIIDEISDLEDFINYSKDQFGQLARAAVQVLDDQLLSGLEKDERRENSAGKTSENEFYINNAGLVLLWPFLTRFFRKLELIADRDFLDISTRSQAIHILQYIATGHTDSHEHQLLLNKILCGYPVEAYLPIGFSYSDRERKEAKELIESVIGHWEIIGNLSVDGFRASFLQRNGRLTRESDHWKLQVESAGYDMLLDRIPWGIQTIRLPWMEMPILNHWR
ncbi:MAG: contractile injection system tape measure protein [Balneolaceae bacterium]|nr:contractile injection system tape measure protein [Balneolaceae bacterium]